LEQGQPRKIARGEYNPVVTGKSAEPFDSKGIARPC
jgi:hypothetical protein